MSRAFKHDIQHPVHLAYLHHFVISHSVLEDKRSIVTGKKDAKKKVAIKQAGTAVLLDSLISAQRETDYLKKADMQNHRRESGREPMAKRRVWANFLTLKVSCHQRPGTPIGIRNLAQKKKDLSFTIRTIEHTTIRCRAVAPHVGPYEHVISVYDTKQGD